MNCLIIQNGTEEVSVKFRAFRSIYFFKAYEEIVSRLNKNKANKSTPLILQRGKDRTQIGNLIPISPSKGIWKLSELPDFEKCQPQL